VYENSLLPLKHLKIALNQVVVNGAAISGSLYVLAEERLLLCFLLSRSGQKSV
jgi:hypothetical protein